MTYCTTCGVQISEEAKNCVNCGRGIRAQRVVTVTDYQLVATNWVRRFIAWLIDVIVLALVFTPFKAVLKPWDLVVPDIIGWIPFVSFGLENIFYFGYWTFMDGTYGQSIGKMAVGIKVMNVNGRPQTLIQAALQSLGKAFLLPLDCIIGWILYPHKKQRFFNYISETIVVEATK